MINPTFLEEELPFLLMPKYIGRRLKNEYDILKCITDKINIYCSQNNEIIIEILKNDNSYLLNIPINYPFIPPTLKINNKPLNSLFKLPSERFSLYLKCVSNIECFCCYSYLCKNNWKPTLTIENIINQIEEYKEIKYLIILKIIVNKIVEKYLIKDIDLESWLFNVYHLKINH
jgi:hypothetical protein